MKAYIDLEVIYQQFEAINAVLQIVESRTKLTQHNLIESEESDRDRINF